MLQKCIEEEERELKEAENNNLIAVNIDRKRLLDENTPSCGAFYADRGSYLLSKDACRPRKSMSNNQDIYSMAEDPITNYNHKSILKTYSNSLLEEYGQKSPCELTQADMSYLRSVSRDSYCKLQSWFWALVMSNCVTLQLGWCKMNYNAEALQVE